MDTKVNKMMLKRLKALTAAVKACKETLKDIEAQCNLISYITMARALNEANSKTTES